MPSERRAGRPAPAARAPAAIDGGSARASLDGVAEGGELGRVGEVADGDEVPDLLEAAGAGEGGDVVAAVVEAARLAVDVADRGVGDGDAVEAGGYVDQDGHGSIVARRRTI